MRNITFFLFFVGFFMFACDPDYREEICELNPNIPQPFCENGDTLDLFLPLARLTDFWVTIPSANFQDVFDLEGFYFKGNKVYRQIHDDCSNRYRHVLTFPMREPMIYYLGTFQMTREDQDDSQGNPVYRLAITPSNQGQVLGSSYYLVTFFNNNTRIRLQDDRGVVKFLDKHNPNNIPTLTRYSIRDQYTMTYLMGDGKFDENEVDSWYNIQIKGNIKDSTVYRWHRVSQNVGAEDLYAQNIIKYTKDITTGEGYSANMFGTFSRPHPQLNQNVVQVFNSGNITYLSAYFAPKISLINLTSNSFDMVLTESNYGGCMDVGAEIREFTRNITN